MLRKTTECWCCHLPRSKYTRSFALLSKLGSLSRSRLARPQLQHLFLPHFLRRLPLCFPLLLPVPLLLHLNPWQAHSSLPAFTTFFRLFLGCVPSTGVPSNSFNSYVPFLTAAFRTRYGPSPIYNNLYFDDPSLSLHHALEVHYLLWPALPLYTLSC